MGNNMYRKSLKHKNKRFRSNSFHWFEKQTSKHNRRFSIEDEYLCQTEADTSGSLGRLENQTYMSEHPSLAINNLTEDNQSPSSDSMSKENDLAEEMCETKASD